MEVKVAFLEKEKEERPEYPKPPKFFGVELRGSPKRVEEVMQAIRAVAKNWQDWEEE